MGLWMRESRFLVEHGVYNGYVLICLECKGLTYIPDNTPMPLSIDRMVHDHHLWCPAYLDEALRKIGTAEW